MGYGTAGKKLSAQNLAELECSQKLSTAAACRTTTAME